MKLGLSGHVQWKNASLALQLAHAFLNAENFPRTADTASKLPVAALPFEIHLPDALGLARTIWPGRSQILHFKGVTFYIDGAHTPESIEACMEWFIQASTTAVETK